MLNKIGRAAGIGAIGMYLFDPDKGKARRARARDQSIALLHRLGRLFDKAGRDLKNRASGALAAIGHIGSSPEPVDDETLYARVRSRIGRYALRPRGVEVLVKEGNVHLAGEVPRDQQASLKRAVQMIRGVRTVESSFVDAPVVGSSVPSIYRSLTRSPAARIALGGGGMMFLASGLTSRSRIRSVVAAAGGATLLAAAYQGLGPRRRRGVEIQKSITIHADRHDVFRFWSHYENFPKFMTHVQSVKEVGTARSRWHVDGPAGISVAWDAEVCAFEPEKLIAWKSIPGSLIQNWGVIRFEDAGQGRTRLHIRIAYRPPGGVLGHSVAWFFGRDLKTEMDEDLLRLKSLLEEERTSVNSRERPGISQEMRP